MLVGSLVLIKSVSGGGVSAVSILYIYTQVTCPSVTTGDNYDDDEERR